MEPGSHKAHDLLHTNYKNRKRIKESEMSFITGADSQKLEISVCVGTNCYLKNSQSLISRLIKYVEGKGLSNAVDVKATFCMEKCGEGPNVLIGDEHISRCTYEKAVEVLNSKIEETFLKKAEQQQSN
jgi:NADH-quinone oxidoreductase subunit G